MSESQGGISGIDKWRVNHLWNSETGKGVVELDLDDGLSLELMWSQAAKVYRLLSDIFEKESYW